MATRVPIDDPLPDVLLNAVRDRAAKLLAETEALSRAVQRSEEELKAQRELLKAARDELDGLQRYLPMQDLVPEIPKHRAFGGGLPEHMRNLRNFYLHDRDAHAGGTEARLIDGNRRYLSMPLSVVDSGSSGVVVNFAGKAVKLDYDVVKPGRYSGADIKRVVTDAAISLLKDGEKLTTQEISDALSIWGIQLAVSNEAARVSQILSEDGRFVNVRNVGWWFKGEGPAGTGPSDAT
ncbi:MAG: hypothetical protein V4757_06745 [Pseudomonadota bacterium]